MKTLLKRFLQKEKESMLEEDNILKELSSQGLKFRKQEDGSYSVFNNRKFFGWVENHKDLMKFASGDF